MLTSGRTQEGRRVAFATIDLFVSGWVVGGGIGGPTQ